MKKFLLSLSLTSMMLYFFVCPVYASTSAYLGGVENYSQEKSNWCWVAGAQIVIQYLTGDFISQCSLYKAGKEVSSCSGNKAGSFYSDEARALEKGISNPGVVVSSSVQFSTIVSQINSWQPLLARIGWKPDLSSGHIIVINGYNTSNDYIDYVFIQQGSSAKSYTSDYRENSYDYVKDNSSWEWTHTRYGMN